MRLPIAPEGWPWILAPLGVAVAFRLLRFRRLAGLSFLGSVGMACFFRDPDRYPPEIPGAVLAPADGKVVQILSDVSDPYVGGKGSQVSIFLSPLDVHVNRSPITGVVDRVDYQAGAKLPAYLPEASSQNERATIYLRGESTQVVVRQVAGVLARRIVCRVRPGEKLVAGERFGMIKFGSRVDLIVPEQVRLRVRVEDRVWAGETVLGVSQ